MSVIRETPLSLATIVKESNVIAEVGCMTSYEESIPVQSESGEVKRPFMMKGLVFRIKNILKNTSDHTISDTIKVPKENWQRSLSQHKAMHADGPSKSFGVRVYNTKVQSFETAEILLLTLDGEKFELVAKQGYESSGALEEIKKLI